MTPSSVLAVDRLPSEDHTGQDHALGNAQSTRVCALRTTTTAASMRWLRVPRSDSRGYSRASLAGHAILHPALKWAGAAVGVGAAMAMGIEGGRNLPGGVRRHRGATQQHCGIARARSQHERAVGGTPL